MFKNSTFLLLATAAFMAGSLQTARAGIVVGTCVAGTHYATIQEAVNAAAPSSTVKVCQGAYAEQVLINKPLTLQGVSNGVYAVAEILSPTSGLVPNATPYAAQVLVEGTTGVTLTNIAIDGANNNVAGCSGVDPVGVLFHNSTGTVSKMVFRNQQIPGAAKGCDHSRGVLALVDPTWTATVTVQNSSFRNFGYEAIRGDTGGLTMNVLNNFVAGTDGAHHSGNGITIRGGATGNVTGNTVTGEVWTDNVYPDFFGAAWGIFIGCSSGVTVSGNRISDTQGGIVLDCVTSNNNTVTGNTIFNTKLYDAIYVGGNNNVIQKNIIVAAGQSGVHIDSSLGGGAGNTITNNTITEACAGLLLSPGVLNVTKPNTFNAVFITTYQNPTCGPLQ